MNLVDQVPVSIVNACLRDGRGGSPTAVLDDSVRVTAALPTDADRSQVPVRFGTSHAVFVRRPAHQDAGGARTRRPDPAAAGESPVELRFFTPAGNCPAAATAPSPLWPSSPDSAAAPSTSSGSASRVAPSPALAPDLDRLRAACDPFGLLGCYVHSAPTRTGRVVARMFAPSIGVPEDIANANSTACLAAHLAERGISDLTVDMGDALGSPATITASARRGPTGATVLVGGAAIVTDSDSR